jgi:hypothetical protein
VHNRRQKHLKQESIMRVVLLFGAAAALSLSLAGCSGKPSAVAPRDQSTASFSSGAATNAPVADARDAPVPQVDGKPMWAANRKHSAEENALFQFTKNGGDFDAKTETAYVLKAHRFVERPPSDAETIDRSNGDKLIYDPKANTFAVVSKDGAPRTMFKPRDGAAYWTQQKDREAKRSKGGSDSGASQG